MDLFKYPTLGFKSYIRGTKQKMKKLSHTVHEKKVHL